MEFLLANHPLDCPICDQGGECDLQVKIIITTVDVFFLNLSLLSHKPSLMIAGTEKDGTKYNSLKRTSPCSLAVTGAALQRAKEL